MSKYAITLARSARKELEALDASIVERIFPAIESLARASRPRGCRKLQGAKNLWRNRVGAYRVIYAVDDDRGIVDVIAIRHQSAAYE